MLKEYTWPGNVRELQNNLQFALIKSKGKVIEPAHLPPEVIKAGGLPKARKQRRRKLDDHDVEMALQNAGGNKVRAAKLLGVSRATLYRFIEEQSGE